MITSKVIRILRGMGVSPMRLWVHSGHKNAWARRPRHVSIVTLLVCWIALMARGEERKRNVLLIVTDDQAQWAVGCYGNKECVTPNMDRLAQAGARFPNAFVTTPVCSPSRIAILTGLYGTEVGVTDWV